MMLSELRERGKHITMERPRCKHTTCGSTRMWELETVNFRCSRSTRFGCSNMIVRHWQRTQSACQTLRCATGKLHPLPSQNLAGTLELDSTSGTINEGLGGCVCFCVRVSLCASPVNSCYESLSVDVREREWVTVGDSCGVVLYGGGLVCVFSLGLSSR